MAWSCRSSSAASNTGISLPVLLLLLLVATASTVARCAWVQDYASNHGCGETVAAELCDPGEPAANRACRDACHYNGCRGGRCVYLGAGDGDGGGGGIDVGRGCHCNR